MVVHTAHISSADFATVDDVKGGTRNVVCEVVQAVQHQEGQELEQNTVSQTYPRCLNIIVAESIIAAGLARLVPMISFAT